MEKYYDPMRDNFGYTIDDIFPLLPWASERNNRTHYYGVEGEFSSISTERDFVGNFMAPNYMGTKFVAFKYIYRITQRITRTGVTTERRVFVEYL